MLPESQLPPEEDLDWLDPLDMGTLQNADLPQPGHPDPPQLSTRQRMELAAMLAELNRRKKEVLRLYRPYPEQEAFHASLATYRLARGGNRGGKTSATAIELGRAVTGTDPHKKYPAQGRCIVVSKDLLDCSKVMYRKLFKPGGSGIKLCQDPETGAWRTWNPQNDGGIACEEAGPIIPRRWYDPKQISWEDKREEIPRTVRLKTGWEITFFSGNAAPPQGWEVDLVLFDEEIPHAAWFSEMVPRIVDRNGRLIWSATAQVGTAKLYDLSKRAEQLKEQGAESPRVTEHVMNVFTNIYISEQQRNAFLSDLEAEGEDEYRVRGLGDFAILGQRVYPEFAPRGVHRIDSFPVPEDWARYVAIDPGRRVAAALFVALPPQAHALNGRGIVYAEAYIRQCNAVLFGQTIKKIIGDSFIQEWLIDHQEGQRHETASGRTIEEQYLEELLKAGCGSNGLKGFIWATPDVDAGILAAKGKLQLREGRPEWLFMSDSLKWFCWEIERYVDQRHTSRMLNILSDRPLGGQDHLMACFRYLANYNMKYKRPPKRTMTSAGIYEYVKRKKKKARQEAGWGDSVRLG